MTATLLLIAALAGEPASGAGLADQLQALLAGRRFTPIATVAALPGGVKSELARLIGAPALPMANPAEPFQVTDVLVPGPELPSRRLRFAGQAGDLTVVHYEAGGIAHSYLLVVFRTSPHGTSAVWSGTTKGPIPTLADLKDAPQYLQSAIPDPFRY